MSDDTLRFMTLERLAEYAYAAEVFVRLVECSAPIPDADFPGREKWMDGFRSALINAGVCSPDQVRRVLSGIFEDTSDALKQMHEFADNEAEW